MSLKKFLFTKPEVSKGQNITRYVFGGFMAFAGFSHLYRKRQEFQALVPPWVPGDPDTAVVASGYAEIALGSSLLALPKYRRPLGILSALFVAAVFPGNIAQYRLRRNAFGLDSDGKRLARLFFQPLLIWAALETAGIPQRAKK